MDASTPTGLIVESLTRSMVEHRLLPGAKLVEQKLATEFGVSRTLIRQALFRLSQNHLVRMKPARGAFVAAPSADEARQVFAVRRMLEAGMVRSFMAQVQLGHIEALQDHIAREADAVAQGDRRDRTVLLGDFHVLIAQLLGNTVLAHMLSDLNSRCALITMLYQTDADASHSQEEHRAIVQAIQSGDEALVLRLMDEHLCHVEAALAPLSTVSSASRPTPAAQAA